MTLAAERQEGGSALTMEEIAERLGAPKRFLEHILLDLKRSGLTIARLRATGVPRFSPGGEDYGALYLWSDVAERLVNIWPGPTIPYPEA